MQTTETIGPTGHGQHVDVTESSLCHPVILRHNDSEVLLVERNGHYSLPTVEIPRWQRVAPHLIAAIETWLHVQAICRFSYGTEPRYVVLDVLDSSGATTETSWVPVSEIVWDDAEPLAVRDGFYAMLRQTRDYATATPFIPFTRSGWFEEVTDWIKSSLDDHGLKLSGPWTQYNIGPASSLLRYETNSLPVWFKAVGGPNLRELEITTELAKLQSRHLPQLLAVHPGWHGWLMLDANGQPLDDVTMLDGWKTAARSLAELQIESIPRQNSLIVAGCQDLRTQVLRLKISSFLNTIAELMKMQPTTPPRILNLDDLHFVEVHLKRALDELESLEMPDTIGHADLNPGNVLVNKDGAVFLDWMQGHIAHPLLTFEYLIALLGRLRPDCDHWQAELRATYRDVWTGVCSEAQIARAFAVSPLVAPFAFAVSWSEWSVDVEGMNPRFQRLLRALARRILAAAQRLSGALTH